MNICCRPGDLMPCTGTPPCKAVLTAAAQSEENWQFVCEDFVPRPSKTSLCVAVVHFYRLCSSFIFCFVVL